MRFESWFRKVLNGKDDYEFIMRDWTCLRKFHDVAEVMATMRYSQNVDPILLNGPRGRRVMVISGRPGTELLGLGGTLMRLMDKGAEVLTVWLEPAEGTAMEEGGRFLSSGGVRYELAMPRYGSSGDDWDGLCISEVRRLTAMFIPDAVFVPSLFDTNVDYRRANLVLTKALENIGVRSKIDVWSYEVLSSVLGNVIVDITDVADRKREAALAFGAEGVRSKVHCALGLNAFSHRFLRKKGAGHYVEKFLVLPVEEYRRLSDVLCDRD